MKPRLPLWENARSPRLETPLPDIYPDRPRPPPLPIVCIGSTRGPDVAEPAAQTFFGALCASDRCALVKLGSTIDASGTPQWQARGRTLRLSTSLAKLPEALSSLMRAQPHLQLLVVNVSAWHLFYETTLSVLIGPLSPNMSRPMQQPLERVSLWMPEARTTVLTDLAHDLSSLVAQAC